MVICRPVFLIWRWFLKYVWLNINNKFCLNQEEINGKCVVTSLDNTFNTVHQIYVNEWNAEFTPWLIHDKTAGHWCNSLLVLSSECQNCANKSQLVHIHVSTTSQSIVCSLFHTFFNYSCSACTIWKVTQ